LEPVVLAAGGYFLQRSCRAILARIVADVSFLDEVIAVELLDDVRLSGAAADVVEDHQQGELLAIDEHVHA